MVDIRSSPADPEGLGGREFNALNHEVRMSKMTRYEAVQHVVSKAHEQWQAEYEDNLPRPPKLASMAARRKQYLNLLGQPGFYLYTWNRWAQKEFDPTNDIYLKGKWFITNSTGARGNHEVPWQVVKDWFKQQMLFQNGHGFALKEGRPIFDEIDQDKMREILKTSCKKPRKAWR